LAPFRKTEPNSFFPLSQHLALKNNQAALTPSMNERPLFFFFFFFFVFFFV
jgi:hypothetical protein